MENEKLKFVKLFLPKEKKRLFARAVISLVVFPFKLESLKNRSLWTEKTKTSLLKPGIKKNESKIYSQIYCNKTKKLSNKLSFGANVMGEENSNVTFVTCRRKENSISAVLTLLYTHKQVQKRRKESGSNYHQHNNAGTENL